MSNYFAVCSRFPPCVPAFFNRDLLYMTVLYAIFMSMWSMCFIICVVKTTTASLAAVRSSCDQRRSVNAVVFANLLESYRKEVPEHSLSTQRWRETVRTTPRNLSPFQSRPHQSSNASLGLRFNLLELELCCLTIFGPLAIDPSITLSTCFTVSTTSAR